MSEAEAFHIQKDSKERDRYIYKMWMSYIQNKRLLSINQRICLKCEVLPIHICACAFKRFASSLSDKEIDNYVQDCIRNDYCKIQRKENVIYRLSGLQKQVEEI